MYVCFQNVFYLPRPIVKYTRVLIGKGELDAELVAHQSE